MAENQVNKKIIAKNSMFLYIRMLLIMVVTLYTSRVVLATLGIEDYGIYNAVGGIVAMMGFLNSSMANAVQRFLSFEMGKGNTNKVNTIFNVSLQAHIIIAAIVFIVMEIGGLWFLNYKMNIPSDRMLAANWVFQCSIFVSMFSILQVPYNALIIAKEQMSVYAYVSIIEAMLKLGIVYLLVLSGFDKLIAYSVFTMVVSIVIIMLYVIYCKNKFQESTLRFIKDFRSLRDLTGFASWNVLGEIAWIFTGQGVNILLNIFFGPVVNAARGIAYQVEGAIMKFVQSFQVALNPQIIKTYAAVQHSQTISLVYLGTRFSYYLVLILSLPLYFEIDYILSVWLKEVPDMTADFCRLIMICSLVQTSSNLFATVAKAYGRIRNYQLIISFILMCNFPLSYLMLYWGYGPLSTVGIAILVQVVCLLARLLLMKNMIEYSICDFMRNVILPLFVVTIIASVMPYFICNIMTEGLPRFLCNLFATEFVLFGIIYFIGLRQNERQLILNYIVNIKNKYVKK